MGDIFASAYCKQTFVWKSSCEESFPISMASGLLIDSTTKSDSNTSEVLFLCVLVQPSILK